MKKVFLLICFTTLLSSCAYTPEFDTRNIDYTLTPDKVGNENNNHSGKKVIWGGTILDTRNLKNSTQIEILAYPLNSSHRPLLDKKPLGRFIMIHSEYLESKIYSQGKQLTTSGIITKNKQAKIGESSYNYPVVLSKKTHLWENNNRKSRTSFHFGIGIGL